MVDSGCDGDEAVGFSGSVLALLLRAGLRDVSPGSSAESREVGGACVLGDSRPGGQPSLDQQHTPGATAHMWPGFPNNQLLLGGLGGRDG